MVKKLNLPAVLDRYELKYLVPWEQVDAITDFALAYCDLDAYSSHSKGNFYQVNSLYFDTFRSEFLGQRRWGKDNRFNMRARTYEDGSKPPYYLEIKQKRAQGMRKFRATLDGREWPNILTDPCYSIHESPGTAEYQNKSLFLRLAQSYAIEPKIFTNYKRRAMFSTVDSYARLTMDFDMKFRDQSMVSGNGDPYSMNTKFGMNNYDNETIYANNTWSNSNVILELKCNIGQVPTWMIDLISLFQLTRIGFSKYLHSSLVNHYDNGLQYMQGDRQGIS